MPELPDVCVYLEALERKVVGRELVAIRLSSPFVLRSYDPPLEATFGRTVKGVRRIGKRLVLEMGAPLPDPLFIVIHLMIAGRLHWKPVQQKGMGKSLATFEIGRAHV